MSADKAAGHLRVVELQWWIVVTSPCGSEAASGRFPICAPRQTIRKRRCIDAPHRAV